MCLNRQISNRGRDKDSLFSPHDELVSKLPSINICDLNHDQLKNSTTINDVWKLIEPIIQSPFTDTQGIELSLVLALASIIQQGGPFGSVIITNDGQIAYGANHVTRKSDPTEHGEVNAIRFALENGYSLENATLYTSCYPCPMCYGLAKDVGIEKIIYCNTEQDAEDFGGFNDQIFWQEVGRLKMLDYGDIQMSTKFQLNEEVISISDDGQDIVSIIRDYCSKVLSPEPASITFKIFKDQTVVLSLFEYTAIRWAKLSIPLENVRLKYFEKKDLTKIEDPKHSLSAYGQKIFQVYKVIGQKYGQVDIDD